MSTPGIAFCLLDSGQAAAHADELRALHAEVYTDPPYRGAGDAAFFGSRLRTHMRQPGFVLAEARHGDYLVGYAYGMPLRASTSWWRDLTTPLPADAIAEHPGRTFALMELAVRAPWRRQGIAAELHDLLLSCRGEERATLTVLPAAAAAQNAFQTWGWRKVARTRGPDPDSAVSDILVIALSARKLIHRTTSPTAVDRRSGMRVTMGDVGRPEVLMEERRAAATAVTILDPRAPVASRMPGSRWQMSAPSWPGTGLRWPWWWPGWASCSCCRPSTGCRGAGVSSAFR